MLKQYVAEAKAKLKEEAYEEALRASTRAVELDALNFQALICMGKSHFHLNNACLLPPMDVLSADAYKRAAAIQVDVPFAWKGMLEVYECANDHAGMLEPLEKLSGILFKNGKFDRCQKMLFDLAKAATEAKQYAKALESWHPLLVQDSARPELFCETHQNDELPSLVDMWLAVLHVIQASKSAGPFQSPEAVLFTLVTKIRDAAVAAGEWALPDEVAVVLDTYADLALSRLVQPGSSTKNQDRQTLDAICRDMITWCPVAKRAAEILLLRAEDCDGALTEGQHQMCDSILRRTDPDNLLLMAVDGLGMFHAKAYPSARETLLACIAAGPHLIAARVALAKIALVPGATFHPQECIDMVHAAQDAVAWRYDNLLTSPSPVLYDETQLSLLTGAAYRAQAKWSEAIVCYEGIIEHEPLLEAGAVGLAEVYLAQDQAAPAADALQFLSPKAPSVALCSARGRLLHLQGDLPAAREVLENGNALAGDALELSVLKRRLADVYWALDGDWRCNKMFCVASLLAAAKLNPHDAAAFAALGRWYHEVGRDLVRAEKCFLKALSLDPACAVAGDLVSDMYATHGEHERNVRLWTDVTTPKEGVAPPLWALRRLAQHQLDVGDEAAIASLHKMLRQEPANAASWAALGHVYAAFGRVMAAQKSYAKAVSLGLDANPSVLCELARIELSVGLFDEALTHLRAAVAAVDAADVAVRKLLADTLFQHAKFLCGQGLYGRAAAHLHEASELLHACTAATSAPALWKLLGDVHCFAFYLAPGDFASWVDFISRGSQAYSTVAKLEPETPQAWYDVGVGLWYEAMACGSVEGVAMGQRALEHAPAFPSAVAALVQRAREAFGRCLALDPLDAMAWNAFGAVQGHVVLKHFGFVRAIQLSNVDCAWANLGMLYAHAALPATAQKAFLSLQGVNPNNPAMWTGYGLLELRKDNPHQAHAAYVCALQMRLDLDVLYGVASTALRFPASVKPKDVLETEHVHFALCKYLERDPFNTAAHNAQGVALMELGLHDLAAAAFARADPANENVRVNVVRNFVAAGDWERALAAWNELMVRDATHGLLAAQIYSGLGRFEDAARRLEALPKFANTTTSLFVDLARCEVEFQARQKLSPVSEAVLAQAMADFPRHEVVAVTLARIERDWLGYWQAGEDAPTVPTSLKSHRDLAPAWLHAAVTGDHIAETTIIALAKLRQGVSDVDRPAAHPIARQVLAVLDTFTTWSPPHANALKWLHEAPTNPRARLAVVLHLFKRYAAAPDVAVLAVLGRSLQQATAQDGQDDGMRWQLHVLRSGYYMWTREEETAKQHAALALALVPAIAATETRDLFAARSLVFTDAAGALDKYHACLRQTADNAEVLAEMAAIVGALGWPKAAVRLWKALHQLDDKWKFMNIVQRYVASVGVEAPKVLNKYLKEIQSFVKDDADNTARKNLVAALTALTA
ncbi:hypothetical protein ACHHYP_09083 [Achlya hypogyna]|uniref:Uncharacterized protein n=1 Tax=Achlya hypogyna TaxID=1202772 RepID=A0A1V9YNS1_ACHHY|nr:hypothetical protein ACHHYP_09083 [Achlya hypogyna]